MAVTYDYCVSLMRGAYGPIEDKIECAYNGWSGVLPPLQGQRLYAPPPYVELSGYTFASYQKGVQNAMRQCDSCGCNGSGSPTAQQQGPNGSGVAFSLGSGPQGLGVGFELDLGWLAVAVLVGLYLGKRKG